MTLGVWIVLYVSDYTLTLAGARKRAAQINFDVNAARDLQVGPTYYTRVEFLGGVATVPAAPVTLCIGNICQENSEVLLTKLPAVKLAHSRVRGILGMDFLTRSGFVLDNRHMELTIGRARLDYGGDMVPLERVFGRLAVRASLPKQRQHEPCP